MFRRPDAGLWNFIFLGALTIPKSELGPLAALPILAVLSVPLIAGLLRLKERVQRGRRREIVGRGGRSTIPDPSLLIGGAVAGRFFPAGSRGTPSRYPSDFPPGRDEGRE
jgi:hypothetical protein